MEWDSCSVSDSGGNMVKKMNIHSAKRRNIDSE